MPKIRKYKRIKKPKKRVNKSIYKSNINKQHVKVNINTGGSIPSISHMQPPAYPNLTDIKSTVQGTFNEVLSDLLKPLKQPSTRNVEDIYPQQLQPQNNKSF